MRRTSAARLLVSDEQLLRAHQRSEAITVLVRNAGRHDPLRRASRVTVVGLDTDTATLQLIDGTQVEVSRSRIVDVGRTKATLEGRDRLSRLLGKIGWLPFGR